MSSRIQACMVIFLATLFHRYAYADGGAVVMRKDFGALSITVFTSPAPLSVGDADISVLVQNRDGQTLLDAQVSIILQRLGTPGKIRALATPAQAQNKLLSAALVNIPEPGEWHLSVVTRHNGIQAETGCDIAVLDGRRTHSDLSFFVFPALAVSLFVLQQRLLHRRAGLRVSKCETI